MDHLRDRRVREKKGVKESKEEQRKRVSGKKEMKESRGEEDRERRK